MESDCGEVFVKQISHSWKAWDIEICFVLCFFSKLSGKKNIYICGQVLLLFILSARYFWLISNFDHILSYPFGGLKWQLWPKYVQTLVRSILIKYMMIMIISKVQYHIKSLVINFSSWILPSPSQNDSLIIITTTILNKIELLREETCINKPNK